MLICVDDYEDRLTGVPILVIEAAFMSLNDFLKDHLLANSYTQDVRQHISLDVAAGLEALHSLNIIQGDIKVNNVLLVAHITIDVDFALL